jgi:guanine deaminase
LSENLDEVAWVRALFADSLDYTDVYDRAGLLGPRTVMAHGIHLSDRELARLAATGTWIAHCPTSNEALASGRMPLERLRAAGVAWVLATDIGAGPKLSMLDAMRAFVEVHRGHAEALATEVLARGTAIPGRFLAQLQSDLAGLGTFEAGAPAHIVALPRPSGALDAEALLQALLATPRDALETLPIQVVCWGRAA